MNTNKLFFFIAVFAVVFLATGAAMAAGPVGAMPMTGANTQGTSLSSSTVEPRDSLAWHVSTVGPLNLVSSCVPLIDEDGNIYVTVANNNLTYAKFAPGGSVLWTQAAGYANYGQGCLGGDTENTYWYVPIHYVGSGAVAKLDASDGSTIWTKTILSSVLGEQPDMRFCQFIMDSGGDIYFPTRDGQVYKVTDLGAIGWEAWKTRTGCSPPSGVRKVAMSPDESVVYNVIGPGALTAGEQFKLVALDATNGNILWSAQCGAESGQGSYDRDWGIGGVPVVDDDGNIYTYVNDFYKGSGTGHVQGINKYNGSGVLQWTWRRTDEPAMTYTGPCGVVLNRAQTRVYWCQKHYWQAWYWAIDANTGSPGSWVWVKAIGTSEARTVLRHIPVGRGRGGADPMGRRGDGQLRQPLCGDRIRPL